MTLAVTCSERHNKVIFIFMVLFDAFDCTFCIFTNIRVSQTGPLPYMAFLGMLVFCGCTFYTFAYRRFTIAGWPSGWPFWTSLEPSSVLWEDRDGPRQWPERRRLTDCSPCSPSWKDANGHKLFEIILIRPKKNLFNIALGPWANGWEKQLKSVSFG